MEDILIQELQKVMSQFPDAEFSMIYYSNNAQDIKTITNEDFKVQS